MQSRDSPTGEDFNPFLPRFGATIGVLSTSRDILRQVKTEESDVISEFSLDELDESVSVPTSVTSEGRIRAGTILGPFNVKKCNGNVADEDDDIFTIIDDSGMNHIFIVANDEAHILKQISPAHSKESSNCNVISTNGDDQLSVIVTRSVDNPKALKGIFLTAKHQGKSTGPSVSNIDLCCTVSKKFACTKCSIAFTNPEILERHQQFYCKETIPGQSQPNPGTSFKDASTGCGNLAEKSNKMELLSQMKTCSSLKPPLNVTEQSRPESLNCFSGRLSASNMPSTNNSNGTATATNGFLKKTQCPLPTVDGLSNNTILLPVAFHNLPQEQLVQIVGPPQTIVPVAIYKNSACSSIRPLLLDSIYASQLCFPRQTVSVANFPSQFSLPLAFFQSPQSKLTRQWSTETGKGLHNGLSTAHELSPSKKRSMSDSQNLEHIAGSSGNGTNAESVFSIPNSPCTKRRKMDSSSDGEPLDLSKKFSNTSKRNQLSPTLTGASEQTVARSNKGGGSTLPQKKFHCDCGVSFVSADTLIAHKKFYCKNRTEAQEEEVMPKLEKVCLTHHVLNIDSFVCALCGYKGFSMRGMKNHVKLTHEMDSDSEKANPVVKVEEP
ncbi:zinc finger, C2H2 type [Ditylenchus destructor]|uniref:Zinc finger, C2H2 type n=1 Tax=Ditylenchus destructor TaxID=166010 RepID=A0AAD4MW34_9BILA|nr:zinc finger, C2H2 type [Ditylenchus destructor]